MRSFFSLVLKGLVLLIVAMLSGLTAMRFAIHGREVSVPNFTGRTMSDGRKLADETGIGLNLERRYYSPTVPEGRILSQVPSAGTKVRRGWQVRVAESMGAQRLQIPSIVGQTPRAAEINIRRRGLEVGTVAQMSLPDTPEGKIVSQSPLPNATGISAPRINLLVSAPAVPQAFVMPNLVGQSMNSVQAALNDAGLRLGAVNPVGGVGTSSSASIVVTQTPMAGDKILRGTPVYLQVR